MPQSLSEIKTLLASRGLRPKHALGQNFLHDGNHLRRIVEAAEVGSGDTVLEVGPGTGTLTGALLDAGAAVAAVELDDALAGIVADRFGERPGFSLVRGDCLDGKHGLNPEMMSAVGDGPFKLVANLPYQAASPLLANLAGRAGRPMSLAVVMLQKEVADRLSAGPGSKVYGALGVLLQSGFAVDRVAVLPASCFWPQPKVQSAVVRLRRRETPMAEDVAGFGRFLHGLFAKRRKQLGAVLGRGFDFPAGVDPAGRAEDLAPEVLAELFRRSLRT
ncbi:16S rRNA (adenine(1518)-N(6)/adenine(1519)-N(6))-dimethyltransferase RsmA [Phycisphaera mikurensis]|uniref:Ribosomal RNA small subunit methyltransferase A n=1 Tax=Phycisphaera mikurensis (strain NBRC 102666 / KCTC 22515 / FYK2301M01) TaxID=1142394 RepID=I0IG22_PHYMF|nr:16S rRNA (adenine(1518)-N(6)/adenine(1519)-N(6))-dimethyltransferase RsmA [Phycisphaera mikurensis]MBB6440406.1 16S rRNA (adenine1518-N6/adenine1519-N6)-dimethyltransferase [Phycisphaera mikurensis]BAM04210.1 ribosomal RNA small subunit methyltransferase A [Phycisphaera mikurensis NBRC 102666]